MIFLIDPGDLRGGNCKAKVVPCDILCTTVCALCKTLCGDVAQPLYGVPPD